MARIGYKRKKSHHHSTNRGHSFAQSSDENDGGNKLVDSTGQYVK
jgi:hypothetical protein